MSEPNRVWIAEVKERWPKALEYIAEGAPKGEFYTTVTEAEGTRLWNLHPDGTWYLWGSDGWSTGETPYVRMRRPMWASEIKPGGPLTDLDAGGRLESIAVGYADLLRRSLEYQEDVDFLEVLRDFARKLFR